MPVIPASPKNRAYSDHPNAASVPIEISVSIVAVPWRRLAHAARWNGKAPHTTTGAASVSDSHCQLSNCRAGIIASSSTGTASTVETISRWRSAVSSWSSRSWPWSWADAGGSGSDAVYPVFSTSSMSTRGSSDGGALTTAFSVA